MRTLILAALVCLIATPLSSQDSSEIFEGKAIALDGNTLGFQQRDGSIVSVRLWGIEAPEMSSENGHGWAARAALDGILAITENVLTCTAIDRDTHGRPVVVCLLMSMNKARPDFAVLRDLGQEMIRSGWAVPVRKITHGRGARAAALSYVTPHDEAALVDWVAEWTADYDRAEADAIAESRGRWKLIFGEQR